MQRTYWRIRNSLKLRRVLTLLSLQTVRYVILDVRSLVSLRALHVLNVLLVQQEP